MIIIVILINLIIIKNTFTTITYGVNAAAATTTAFINSTS